MKDKEDRSDEGEGDRLEEECEDSRLRGRRETQNVRQTKVKGIKNDNY